ncbi:MAG: hypothetical protein ACW99U_01845 [Candidatus Thorarchaeota archaeon]
MVGHNVQAILIMEKGGIPLFFMKLDPKAIDLDPMLVSGFFTALKTFSAEVIDKSAAQFQVDYGARLFTIFSGEEADLVTVTMGKWNDKLSPILSSLLTDFEKDCLGEISRDALDTLDIYSEFERFREDLIGRLSFKDLSEDWVPLMVSIPDTESFASSSPIFPFIDGMRTIGEIRTACGMSRETVLQEISRLWAQRAVKFHNMLDTSDIVMTTSRMDHLLQSGSEEWALLQKHSPAILAVLPRFSGLMDGRRAIGEILKVLEGQVEEKDLFVALDYLLDNEAIEPLSPERRRVLLVKEALEISIKTAEGVYSGASASKALQKAMAGSTAPEVVGELRLDDEQWKVEYDSRIYEGMDPRRLMDIYAEWIKILAQFTSNLDQKKRKVFIESLTNGYLEYLFRWYTPDDFRGFEEFSFWLELTDRRG